MGFSVKGISAEPYLHLYGMSDDELMAHGARRYTCDANPGFPDRIEMRDAEIGETLLLVNHVSLDANSPYDASHAIFVLEGAVDTYEKQNEIPSVMFSRLLSLRAFDDAGMMRDAKLAQGDDIQNSIETMFEDINVAYIDAHNAERGCFAGKITRT